MNDKHPSIDTATFLNLICEHGNKRHLNKLPADKLKQLESCADNTVIVAAQGIGAIGDLLFWSYQLEEPPIESTDQIGLLLRLLSDLLLKADFVRSEAVYKLNNT